MKIHPKFPPELPPPLIPLIFLNANTSIPIKIANRSAIPKIVPVTGN